MLCASAEDFIGGREVVRVRESAEGPRGEVQERDVVCS